ncbi:glycosyltransferase family 2 protein [bacterium]|nr:glycosyltransferase family 2 protein [candidate division CSSED10-310 bacterium]
MDISVVIPFYNEEETVRDLVHAIHQVMNNHPWTYEIIAVDDGSRDGTWAVMTSLAAEDQRFRPILLRRNFGQTPALAAGLDRARGKRIITMDGDFQNDPADIPVLMAKMDEGFDMVSGWRTERKDPLSKRFPSRLANRLIQYVTRVPVNDLGCSLKIYSREIVSDIQLYGELHRFLPVLAKWAGARIGEVPVHHHPRRFGHSKYGISRTLRVLLDLITVKFLMNYSTSPLRMFGTAGFLSIISGIAMFILTIIMKLSGIQNINRNPLLLISVGAVIVGVQFILMGLLGEISIRTYYESQSKPIYLVRETLNFDA